MPDIPSPKKFTPYEIPEEGSLGLLALGYRGLDAWREVRGTDWIEARRKEHEELVARLEEKKAGEAAEKGKAEAAAGAGSRQTTEPKHLPASVLESLSITIVSGLPRSGTSLMMQMLTAGGMEAYSDGKRVADESNPRGYFEHEKVKGIAKDSTWLKEVGDRAVKIVAPLLRYLPPGPTYRVILMERDIEEILRSQQGMLDRDGRSPADRDVLKRAYQRQLGEAKAWSARHGNVSLLPVSHREAIDSPATVVRSVREFLGGNLQESDMIVVVDRTLHRERA